MLTKDEQNRLKIMLARTEASDVMANLKNTGSWIKDMEFKFLDITEEASNILYGILGRECIGKTDLELAKIAGVECTEDMFSEVCRGSDLFIYNNAKNWIYKDTIFIELITSITGNKHIWQTTKGIKPPQEWHGRYYHWEAVFLDRLLWYENALKVLENPLLEKLNDNLYYYKV